MNNFDLLKMGFHNLWTKKARTFLTVLGVVIGTCSIVVMMSIGIANDQGTKEWIESMGDLSIIEVYSSGMYGGDMNSRNSKKQIKLDDKGIEKLEKIDGVKAVMPIKEMRLKIKAGKMLGRVNVIGIKPEVMEAFGFKVQEGRLLQETDKETLVFGAEIPDRFYNPKSRNRYDRDPDAPKVNLISNKLMLSSDRNYGEKIRNQRNYDDNYKPPKPHKVKGVGLLEESGREQDWNAYMNITALEKIIKEDQDARHEKRRRSDNEDQYEQVKVKVKDINRVEEIQEKIKAMGLNASSLTDWLKSMREQMKKAQMMLGGIGAVSLLVAAIGITNTMIMSIYERTREIGVMKVIGANLSDIKKLFLFEAAMIGFVGGILGIGLSYGLSFALNKFGGGSSEGIDMIMGGMSGGSAGMSIIPIELAIGGVAFATVIGVISGYLPARRAMNLSALEAIKTE